MGLQFGKQYRLLVDHILPNTIDIDGEGISFNMTFTPHLEEMSGGMQVDFDDCEKYDEVCNQFTIASRELLKAFRLLEKYTEGEK